jgi:hypothetical protein
MICLLFTGCSPSSLEDYRHEGEAVCRELTADLQCIQTREDLVSLETKLKKDFEKLVAVILDAQQFIQKHPDSETLQVYAIDTEMSDRIKVELQRVYQIEGAKEVIEKAQRESMLRLDGYAKMRQKKLRVKQ